MVRNFFSICILSLVSLFAWGQAEVESSEVARVYQAELEEQYNPNSINPIPKYEHHYKRRVWRTIDLYEKQNKGFFSNNGEITRLIVDAVKSGEIPDIYASDSLTTKLSTEEFLNRLVMTQRAMYDAWDPTRDWYTDEITSYNGKNYRVLVDNTGKNPETSPDEWAITSEGRAADYLPRDMNILR